MSLIPFHRGLISAAIVFCFGYGAFEIAEYSSTGRGGSAVMALIFIALGFGLIYYLSRLNRFLGYEPREGDER